MSTFIKSVPLLVQDAALSEAMTIDGGGDTALRVTGGGNSVWTAQQAGDMVSASSDIQQDTSSLLSSVGTTTDPDTAETVIGLLKSIVSNLS